VRDGVSGAKPLMYVLLRKGEALPVPINPIPLTPPFIKGGHRRI